MSYQPFLISNYKTGYDKELQPWLLPNDAFIQLEDCYVYRGVLTKRDGYVGFARGTKSIFTESRMVHRDEPTYTVTGVINSANMAYTIDIQPPIEPGSLTITGSNPAQVMVDDGAGAFTGDGTGTVNYVTGAVSISFTAAPIAASTITLVYGNFSIGDGTATYGPVSLSNVPIRRGTVTITAGAQVMLDNGLGAFTGDGTGTIDYTTGDVSVVFTGNVTAGVPITISYDYHPGLPVMGIMNFYPTNNVRQLIVADTSYINRYNPTTDVLDDISPAYTLNCTATDFFSWVNYQDASSNPRLLFCNGVVGDVIQVYDGSTVAAYAPTFTTGTLNARQMFEVRDRLVLFQTIEAGTLYPRRIRISGTGSNSDNFDITATGAGFIDIPDNTWYYGAAFNRDDILFFTEAATWMLKYTGNDVTPFILEKIDGSRGSSAAFSVITYLNRTLAASPRGLIISDGYSVERMDATIPDFSFNEISSEHFEHCFAGFLDEDRDVYLLYPSIADQRPSLLTSGESDKILVSNLEEDNFAIYKIPLSCIGNFETAVAVLWSDLTAENGIPDWDALGSIYSNWNAFPFVKGTPIAIGGGHKGEIWSINNTESQDNPVQIRAIAKYDENLVEVTTDWNNYDIGDYIVFESVAGLTEVNHKQAAISEIVTANTTFRVELKLLQTQTYTSGGQASKCIQMEAMTKQLNPFVDQDKKLRIGWCYFYVSVADTILEDSDGNPVNAYLDIDVITNDNHTATGVPPMSYRVDCTNLTGEIGTKNWVKIWINQTAKFIRFRYKNNQAGANIQVHAVMPGMSPTGRLV